MLQLKVDSKGLDKIITIVVPRDDIANADLDDLDRLVFESPTNTAADVLQSLELLARSQVKEESKR